MTAIPLRATPFPLPMVEDRENVLCDADRCWCAAPYPVPPRWAWRWQPTSEPAPYAWLYPNTENTP